MKVAEYKAPDRHYYTFVTLHWEGTKMVEVVTFYDLGLRELYWYDYFRIPFLGEGI